MKLAASVRIAFVAPLRGVGSRPRAARRYCFATALSAHILALTIVISASASASVHQWVPTAAIHSGPAWSCHRRHVLRLDCIRHVPTGGCTFCFQSNLACCVASRALAHCSRVHCPQVNAKKEQRYDNWAAFARRYERAYLVQAKNKVQTAREAARIMDSEREIMAAVPGWTAGKSPYYTQPQVPRVIFKPNLPEEAK